jgi:hypothetical protein
VVVTNDGKTGVSPVVLVGQANTLTKIVGISQVSNAVFGDEPEIVISEDDSKFRIRIDALNPNAFVRFSVFATGENPSLKIVVQQSDFEMKVVQVDELRTDRQNRQIEILNEFKIATLSAVFSLLAIFLITIVFGRFFMAGEAH